MSVETLVLSFEASSEASSVVEWPEDAWPGAAVTVRLRAGSASALAGYKLWVDGLVDLDAGKLDQEPGLLSSRADFINASEADLTTPIQSLVRVEALSQVVAIGESRPMAWATRGQDVTAKVRRVGLSSVGPRDELAIYGSLLVEFQRAPWVRSWTWTVPADRVADVWFFLHAADGSLFDAHSLALGLSSTVTVAYRDQAFEVYDVCTQTPVPGAKVYIDDALIGTTNADGRVMGYGLKTGTHALRVLAPDHQDSAGDELANDQVMIA